MKYDFSVVPDRSNSSSSKWRAAPNADVMHVPLSTADMEFPTAPKIVEAIKDLADTTILGYTDPTPQYYEAVCGWMKRRHDFEVKPEWILPTPGVVYALGMLIDALSEPGESVIVISPVYYPFDLAVTARERNILYSDLKLEDGRYTIDYADLEEKAAHTLSLVTHLNIFAYRACEAAYNPCEDWLEEAIQVIHGNAVYIVEFMREHFPEIKVFPLDGTYLLWLDMRGLGMTHKELETLMKQDAGLYLDEGYIFGLGAGALSGSTSPVPA